MAAWKGWQKQLLEALKVPTGTKNRVFLSEWEKLQHTACKDNPLSVTENLAGSKRCAALVNGEHARAYAHPKDGVRATVRQLEEAPYAPILAALKTGDPFTFTDWQEVVGSLGTWGAHAFAAAYSDAAGAPSVGKLPAAGIGGYTSLSHSLARTLPTALQRSRIIRRQALRRLGAPRSLGG